MNDSRTPPHPAEHLRRLWSAGQTPDLDAYLEKLGPLGNRDLVGVLLADQSERWRAGMRIQAEEYLRRYPIVASDPEAAVDLIHGEYLLSEQLGQRPDLEAFVRRFPNHDDTLRLQIDLHLAMMQNTQSALQPPDRRKPSATDTTLFPSDANWTMPPGETFGDYQLIELIARGGMGVVYKARQPKLDRVVAIKLILAGHLASEGSVERFRTEARAAAHLDHPGIVPVFEIGEHDGLHYFTMAFIEGRSLADRLRDGPLPATEAARIVRDLCGAVAYAHDHGIVHRDLKPANVILDEHGHSKLTDFGLAKRTYDASEMTGTGEILGTPAYMSPEQAQGGESGIGPLTDVYGMGALLFALLTGRPPFQAATPMETIQHVISADPPRPQSLNPGIPRDLQTICLKCLEKSPAKRYASAVALAADLDRFLEGRPIWARPVGVIEKAYRWFCRRPVMGSMAAALAVLFVCVPILFASLWGEAEARAKVEADGRVKAVAARTAIEAAEVARTRELFSAYVNEAAALRSSPKIGRRFQAIERIVAARDLAEQLKLPAADYARLRSEAIGALSLTDLRASTSSPGWLIAGAPESLRFMRERDSYLEWDPPNGLLVRRGTDGQTLHRLAIHSTNEESNPTQISSDNRFVFHLSANELVVWRVDGKQPVEIIRRKNIQEAGFAPDRAEIIAMTPSRLIVAEPLDGQGQAMAIPLPAPPEGLVFVDQLITPGPRRQLAVVGKDCVRIFDLNSGQYTARFEIPDQRAKVVWSGDGDVLAASCWDKGVVLYRPKKKKQELIPGPLGGPVDIAFDRSGRFLLLVSAWTGQNILVDVESRRPELRFHSAELEIHSATPNHKPFASRYWAPAVDGIHRNFPVRPEDGTAFNESLAVHPGGRLLATPTSKGIVLDDLESGKRLGLLPAKDVCRCARFDSAGNLYALQRYVAESYQVARWPVIVRGNRYLIGSVAVIGETGVAGMDVSANGRLVVKGIYYASSVFDRTLGYNVAFKERPDIRAVAINPDGSLVAAFPWGPQGFQVWETKSGKVLLDHPTGSQGRGRFSPDGKYLITFGFGESNLLAWSIPDCKLVQKLGPIGTFAISPDSRYVAVTEPNGKIRLNRIADGVTIARFDAPGDDYLIDITFSPGGRYLLGLNTDRNRRHVWDLWKLREQLQKLKLDWEEDPPPNSGAPSEPIEVRITSPKWWGPFLGPAELAK